MIATKNAGKAREFEQLFAPLGFQVSTLLDFPDIEDIEETGTTFEENALLKARTLANILKIPVLADDSGLIVDALGGDPGVYSARYAGEPKNDRRNLEKVLNELGELPLPERTARFYCVIAFVTPDLQEITASGSVEGKILFEPVGENGFGYDPVFYADELGKAFAECSDKEKNSVSHRSRALQLLQIKLGDLKLES